MLPLEDNYEDIIGKAGHGHAPAETAPVTDEMQAALAGKYDAAAAAKIAHALNLNPRALAASGERVWHPRTAAPTGVRQFVSAYHGGMTVNCYLVWDPAGAAALFDTGTQPDDVLTFLRAEKLSLQAIFITHTHGDHIARLPQLRRATGAPVFASGNPFAWGEKFRVGALTVETRQTTGHAADGTTYVITGLAQPVAVTGDAVFAGSMGGAASPTAYREALATNLQNIYSLPDHTLLCPGHGPLTTVLLEKTHNPFYISPS